jgi:hypothetical protein
MLVPHGSLNFRFGASPVLPGRTRERIAMAGRKVTKRVVDSLKIEAHEYAMWDDKMPASACVYVRPAQNLMWSFTGLALGAARRLGDTP